MTQEYQNIFLFLFICFLIYALFRYIDFNKLISFKEGMTDGSGNQTNSTNGIGGNATAFAASIQNASIQLQNTFSVSNYRSQYETVILNLDDLINNLMLQTVLNINVSSPQASLEQLGKLNQAKSGLNNVMKFLDSQ